MAPQTTSRRERFRQATLQEIHDTVRKLLISGGSSAVTINAVAREMGLSGPALYRYYPSHEALVGAVTADFYQELAKEIEDARDSHASDTAARRLLAMCRAMRGWVITHRAEFGWMFASPVPAATEQPPGSPRQLAAENFEKIFLEQIAELWATSKFPVPKLKDLAPSLRTQLRDYSRRVDGRLPPEAAHVYLSIWIRLYGLLCMEVLNQLDFAYTDVEPVFEECLHEVFDMLGLEYEAPAVKGKAVK